MRQAGRYLPEYRAVRERVDSFFDLCLSPDLAVEVSLQPVHRFGLDAAIIFSDILVVPYGLGQRVTFEEGQGPLLEPIRHIDQLKALSLARLEQVSRPVAHAVRGVRRQLSEQTALIGFAGAPWTVASYMVEGRSSRDFEIAKTWAYREPQSFGLLIALLVDATTGFLLQQIEAGAELLQIFDSWAGVLPPRALERWSLEPTSEIVRRVKAVRPDIPIIVFPRGVGASFVRYAAACGCDGLSIDTVVSPAWAAKELQPGVTVQGNLDPMLLVVGNGPMEEAASEILDQLGGGPFIFNLGHGILPQTDPEHVAALCQFVHGWKQG
jgi:uroporphyrinogen decarboxylase